ncbi:complement regulator-acquiring protein [Borrelia crocidurae]|uniref:Borrelia burgdorferi virulent strain associated lipoprotein-containing protein n=1 Tax=Borrelia crocidurae (strain Achema) TaxID=1155096 RepID=I0FE11_BORCA|nr:complement regulator-acquiring protein [Borrelia crocidurae]AFI31717.1 Borrelia burgdorferi virulent strain associated lipoprotein-containing protein [Borrelia crocidurae str. Achema]
MRNNILKNIITISALTAFIFTSCNTDGTLDIPTNGHKDGASTKTSGDGPSNILRADGVDNGGVNDGVNDEAKQLADLIVVLKEKVENEAKVNKDGKEPDNTQYGLKDTVFKLIKDDKNKTYDEDTNKDTRHKFYGSLSWKKEAIEGLGEVLAKLAGEATYKDTWPKKLIEVGEKVQGVIQVTFGDIETKKDNLNTLSLEKINELSDQVKKLEEARTTWITFVSDLIKDYKDDKDSIKTTVKNLVDNYLTPKYKDSLSGLITSSEKLGEDIKKILQ